MSPKSVVSNPVYRTPVGETVFLHKYAHQDCETWSKLSNTLVNDVCKDLLSKDEIEEIVRIHSDMKFIAGGRYLYYAGRPRKFFCNCYMLRSEEDTRQDWATLSWKATACLMTGGGIGNDYSAYRPNGSKLASTGGVASGAVSSMRLVNEIGREVMQGGGRRSAMYASLNWKHEDIREFLTAKNWYDMRIGNTTLGKLKETDPNFPAPLDMTNVSCNYDNAWLHETTHEALSNRLIPFANTGNLPQIFLDNVLQAMVTGDPGMSFNFFDKEKETLRNACGEACSEDDSDVCNLGSLNMSRIDSLEEWKRCVTAAIRFLLCGSIRTELPYERVGLVRDKNRRLGLGIMGVHEWLLKRGYRYEMTDELRMWMEVYRDEAKRVADALADSLGVSRPVAWHAIAPAGTISILAGTTSGIEPIYATAYKRRYLTGKNIWKHQYVVDGTARLMHDMYSVNLDDVETAYDLAQDPERRIRFQADMQDYVSQGISSTINLPKWGSEHNNENLVEPLARLIAGYAHRLRGITCYPDGAHGAQPITKVDWKYAMRNEGKIFDEEFTDICSLTGKGGTCNV